MNILLITGLSPEDSLNGQDLRLWHILDRGNADVLCFQRKSPNFSSLRLLDRRDWKNIQFLTPEPFDLRISRMDLIPQHFLLKSQSQTQLLRSAVKEYLEKKPKTLIITSGYSVGLMASTFLSGQFVFDCSDSMSLYFWRRNQALNSIQWLKKANSIYMSAVYRAVESYIARHAALYLVPSEADLQHILQGYSKANVMAIGTGTEWLDLPPITPQPNRVELALAFHGSMTWEPNRSAAMYLIQEVFPIVKAVFPNAKLRIAGAPVFKELAAFQNSDGIEICGFVDDIRSWLAECDVYAMPMLQGSGVKTKLIEAMAAGLPIVTNSRGAEALPPTVKDSIWVADGNQEIARAIINLFQDSHQRVWLRKKARRAAENEFHGTAMSRKLRQLIETSYFSTTSQ